MLATQKIGGRNTEIFLKRKLRGWLSNYHKYYEYYEYYINEHRSDFYANFL